MANGGVNIGEKAIPHLVDVGHITGKGWNGSTMNMADKGFLNKHNLWMVTKHISLKGSKLVKRCYPTGIPGEKMER